ncbi:RNA polymerase subunit, putative, partial [Hepatocystis sp. ex Piliocolobus tephrosceles]
VVGYLTFLHTETHLKLQAWFYLLSLILYSPLLWLVPIKESF